MNKKGNFPSDSIANSKNLNAIILVNCSAQLSISQAENNVNFTFHFPFSGFPPITAAAAGGAGRGQQSLELSGLCGVRGDLRADTDPQATMQPAGENEGRLRVRGRPHFDAGDDAVDRPWDTRGHLRAGLPERVLLPGDGHVGNAVRDDDGLPDRVLRVYSGLFRSGHYLGLSVFGAEVSGSDRLSAMGLFLAICCWRY